MRLKLILPILATMLVPLAAAFFKYPDTHIPPGFLVFPPQFIVEEPSFNLIYFLLMLVAVVWALLVLFWPEKVGFKRNTQPMPSPTRANLPWWFYIGLGGTVLFWWLMWSRSEAMLPWVYYAFTPLWWSFIILLDGIVYRFNGGRSLCATKPGLLLFMAGVSFFGWMYFEYYDYFVLENWYYPNAENVIEPRNDIATLLFLLYHCDARYYAVVHLTLFLSFHQKALSFWACLASQAELAYLRWIGVDLSHGVLPEITVLGCLDWSDGRHDRGTRAIWHLESLPRHFDIG